MAIQYLHPYIQTNIFDNSEIYDNSVSGPTTLFQPYFSERGVSDELESFSNLSDFLKAKGYPNFRKYGQSMYNIINWLKGGGRVVGIRLTADNATYANAGLNVKTKVEETTVQVTDSEGNVVYESDGVTPQTTTEKEVLIKLETVTLPQMEIKDNESIQLMLDEYEGQVDDEGYTSHILLLFASKGKGSYGNNISVRITENKSGNNTYNFKMYNLTVVHTKENGSVRLVEGPTSVSLYPDAMSLGGSSLLIQQIIEDYFTELFCFYNTTAYDDICDVIMGVYGDVYDNTGEIDLLYGDDNITVDDTGAKSLFSYSGLYFENGSDGDLYSPKTTARSVQEQLLINCFNGTITSDVYDKKRFPFDVVLDFNTSPSVKLAINDFVNQRGDCICMLDTGELSNANSTVNWKRSNLVIDDYLSSIWSQMFVVFDQYTAQDIYVTPTYFLANKIPTNDNNYGVQYPFVGPNRGIIAGFKSLNWTPNEEQKEALYENRINYIEQNYRNTRFMGQLTAQSKTTSLSDINHVRVMLQIVRSVEELMENYIFEMATETTMANINASLANLLSTYITNGACTTCEGTCTQTVLEREEKIAHVTINLVFTDVIERIVIDININR